MESKIKSIITNYVENYKSTENTQTRWKAPIIAIADTRDPLFDRLKDVAGPSHALPRDFMADGRSVISYFLPFANHIGDSNKKGRTSSLEWATAYIETNNLIADLNSHIKKEIEGMNYDAELIPMSLGYTSDNLYSNWSQRHVAYIAGLGKFGINNMLITEKGCCGRLGSIITNLELKSSRRNKDEYCLAKAGINCRKCIDNCINGALGDESFHRDKCYDICVENARIFKDLGEATICGKCLVALPCSFENPMEKIKSRF